MAEERNTASFPSSAAPDSKTRPAKRNNPYLPTPTEALVLGIFPAILVFGTIFSVLSPDVRRAEFDPATQAHSQDPNLSPSYFARKDNILNVHFVKKGWFWTMVAFAVFASTHPALRKRAGMFQQAVARLGLATLSWFLVTTWFFGPAIIDRSFRWTGGKCELVEDAVAEGTEHLGQVVTAVACKAAGGAWKGGHDISGHVFLLTLASGFLMQEVGWAWARYAGKADERSIVMADGAVKNAKVEADASTETTVAVRDTIGWGGRFAAVVVGLSLWMLLMTAIYFHTWFEKVCTWLEEHGLGTQSLTGVFSLLALWRPPSRCISSTLCRDSYRWCA